MRMLIAFLFAASIALPSARPVRALDVIVNTDALRSQSDSAMKKVGKGDLEGALQDLSRSWPLPASELEAMIEQTRLQLPGMKERFGEVLGYEFIREDIVGTSFVRRTYIQRFERHATRWIITYYRNASGWVVNSVTFDDNLIGLFEREHQPSIKPER